MKFGKNKPGPEYGEKRIVSKFALFPIKAGDQVRWLENVKIEQQYTSAGIGCAWFNNKFID